MVARQAQMDKNQRNRTHVSTLSEAEANEVQKDEVWVLGKS